MRRKTHITAVVLSAAVLGTSLLTACGSGSSISSSDSAEADYYSAEAYDDGMYSENGYSALSDYAGEVYSEGTVYSEDAAYSGNAAEGSNLTDGEEDSDANPEQKLIVTWNISMETEKYDDAMTAMKNSVKAAGGYIESEDESTYYDGERYEYLTIRSPAENTEDWVEGVSAYGTITDRSKSTEDITLTYVDTQSRLDALRAEQQVLIDMMEKAEDISDLITIQSELTNVNSDIESYESQLRVMDNQVNYSTIYLSMSEVNREIAMPQTFWEEVKETFLNSMEGLENVTRRIAVGLLGNSVVILIWAVIIAGVVLAAKKIGKQIREHVGSKAETESSAKAEAESSSKAEAESSAKAEAEGSAKAEAESSAKAETGSHRKAEPGLPSDGRGEQDNR